jgi:hypothetical protein
VRQFTRDEALKCFMRRLRVFAADIQFATIFMSHIGGNQGQHTARRRLLAVTVIGQLDFGMKRLTHGSE